MFLESLSYSFIITKLCTRLTAAQLIWCHTCGGARGATWPAAALATVAVLAAANDKDAEEVAAASVDG